VIGDGEIERPVPVEVGDGDLGRIRARGVRAGAPESAMPVPEDTVTSPVPPLPTTRSSLPSRLKSPAASAAGFLLSPRGMTRLAPNGEDRPDGDAIDRSRGRSRNAIVLRMLGRRARCLDR
jgi:hypothetical protein